MSLAKNYVSLDNLHKICRLCLEEKSDSFNIQTIIIYKENDVFVGVDDILGKFGEFQTENEDLLPKLICQQCLQHVQTAYLLLIKYENANKLLKEFLCSFVKEEINIDFTGIVESEKPEAKKRKVKKTRKKRKCKSDEEEEVDTLQPKVYPCPICMQEFTALGLREHAQTHKSLKKYLTIPESEKVAPFAKFSTNRHLTNSNITIFQKEGKRHKCPYCNLEFAIDEFRIHIDTHRQQCEFKCDKCDRVFKRLNHLNTHRVKHLKEYPYKCEHCDKGFVIKTNYDCHMLTHTNEELPHECKFCLRRFSNPEHLNRHQIIHTENVTYSVKYRVCKCHHCLKSFKDKDELKSHVCMPVEQAINMRYPCKSCKKVFKHSSGLYNHNRNVHRLKGTKTLCSVCGKYVANIYNHMMRHSGEKPFHCNQCDKRFSSKPQLKQHLLVHSGLKPYVCSICGKAFNNLYNLQVHERIHKGDRCHICVVCKKGFLEKSYLKKHMNVHAKQDSGTKKEGD